MLTQCLIFAVAMILAWLTTRAARSLAMAQGVLDCPDFTRKLQRAPVPLLGGVAVLLTWTSVVVTAALARSTPVDLTQAIAVLGSLWMLCAVGVCDDIWRIRVRWKLLGQLVATLPLVYAGCGLQEGATLASLPASCAVPLCVLWYMTCMNAMNFIDGLDGLASATGICASLAIALLAAWAGEPLVAVCAVALAGALAGFLMWNAPSARIYLGDAGSMTIGLLLGLLALKTSHGFATPLRPVLLVAIMALPLADLALAVVRRLLVGDYFWSPDRAHVHHRLLDQKRSVWGVLGTLTGVCVAYQFVAVLAALTQSAALALLSLVAVSAVLVWRRLLGHCECELASEHLARLAQHWMARTRRSRTSDTYLFSDNPSPWEREQALLGLSPDFPRLDGVQRLPRQGFLARELPAEASKEMPLVVKMRISTQTGEDACSVIVESDEPSLFDRQEWPSLMGTCRHLIAHWVRHGRRGAMRIPPASETPTAPASPSSLPLPSTRMSRHRPAA